MATPGSQPGRGNSPGARHGCLKSKAEINSARLLTPFLRLVHWASRAWPRAVLGFDSARLQGTLGGGTRATALQRRCKRYCDLNLKHNFAVLQGYGLFEPGSPVGMNDDAGS